MDLLSGYDSGDEETSDNKRKLGEEEGEGHNKKAKRTEETKEHKKGDEINDKSADRKVEEEDDELPPLPDMFEANEDQSYEDKSKHQGRVRTFKHVVGNYATYVHIPGNEKKRGGEGRKAKEKKYLNDFVVGNFAYQEEKGKIEKWKARRK
jgi:hypothetical protein